MLFGNNIVCKDLIKNDKIQVHVNGTNLEFQVIVRIGVEFRRVDSVLGKMSPS